MSQEKTVEEQVEELNKVLKANEYEIQKTLAEKANMKVQELEEMSKKFLNQAAKEIMAKKVSRQVILNDDGTGFKSVYFSVLVREENLELGIKEMCDIANDLANKGLINSVLAPISAINLAKMPFKADSLAVFFFPLVPFDQVEEMKKNKYFAPEGAIGPTLGDLEKDLLPGEFLAEAYFDAITQNSITKENFDIEGQLFEIVSEFLSLLPKGTRFLGADKCATFSLSAPYELKFFNPLMKEVKRVELNHVRSVALLENNKVEQFNLLTGVRYFYRNGDELPPRLDK